MAADMLELATRRLAAAGYAEHFEAVSQTSYDVELAEPADVLISEIVGNLADNENVQPILADAIARLLRPRGAILPLAASSLPGAGRRPAGAPEYPRWHGLMPE